MSTSQALFDAEKAVGKARVSLSKVVGHTDLTKNADYQRAMEAAHKLTLHAITLIAPVGPLVRRLAEEFKRIEDEKAEQEAAAQQRLSAQGKEIGAGA